MQISILSEVFRFLEKKSGVYIGRYLILFREKRVENRVLGDIHFVLKNKIQICVLSDIF